MKTDTNTGSKPRQVEFSAIPPPPELPWVDPWRHEAPKATRLPSDATHVCLFQTIVNPFDMEEAAFLVRHPDRDELWVTDDVGPIRRAFERAQRSGTWQRDRRLKVCFSRAVADVPMAEAWASALSLLHTLIRSRVGFGWPRGLLVEGLIEKDAFTHLVSGIEAALDENVDAAKASESELVATARELGLDPEPTGQYEDEWRARCPGSSGHPLYIRTRVGLFFCGYCRRHGGWEELCAFVAERAKSEKGQ